MANTLLTIDMVTRRQMSVLHNAVIFCRNVDRSYQEEFAIPGSKIGTTLRIRHPTRYVVTSGATFVEQDSTDKFESLVMATQKNIGMGFTQVELLLSLDDFTERYIVPAGNRMASQIDIDGLSEYKNVWNSVGTPGTTPSTSRVILDAKALLHNNAMPNDDMCYGIVNPEANAALIDGHKGLFHASAAIEQQYRRGMFGGNVWGLNQLSMSQNVAKHTTGSFAGTPLVNGASQTGTSLITDGWTASQTGVVKAGDVFTVTSGANTVNAVNPETKVTTGARQQFVVTADANSDGGGAATLSIKPAITTSGAFQTVTASPSDNAALTFIGSASTTYPQNLIYHKKAFVLAVGDFMIPKDVSFGGRKSFDGLAFAIISQFDATTYKTISRLDTLYGWLTNRPEWACRVWG